MSSKDSLPPKEVLYKNIFENRSQEKIIPIISEAIPIIIENARGLLKDADLLNTNNRYMVASFLGFTALEEIAKIRILVDACRLNFEKHGSTLKNLCKAFYDHLSKYAYNRIFMHPNIKSMVDAKKCWEVNTKKVWLADPGSDQPDERHPTNFLREMPLYVDFDYWAKEWFSPQGSRGKISIAIRKFTIDDAKEELTKIEKTYQLELYETKALSILNKIFKKKYVNESTPTNDIKNLYKKTWALLIKENTLSIEDFQESQICVWPLYHFC